MARKPARDSAGKKKRITQNEHPDKKRVNIPPVGLVTPATDPIEPAAKARKTYQYDPHLDPQLVWAGKAERTSFEVLRRRAGLLQPQEASGLEGTA